MLSYVLSSLILVQAVPEAPPEYQEVGKTSYATVQIDPKSVVLGRDSKGELSAQIMVKIVLNEPAGADKTVHAVINGVIFSCGAKAAKVVGTIHLDAKGKGP